MLQLILHSRRDVPYTTGLLEITKAEALNFNQIYFPPSDPGISYRKSRVVATSCSPGPISIRSSV